MRRSLGAAQFDVVRLVSSHGGADLLEDPRWAEAKYMRIMHFVSISSSAVESVEPRPTKALEPQKATSPA